MPDVDTLYREGVAAIRAGDKSTGREKLMEVVRQDELHEQAWLWLSAVVDDREEKIICLENVLTINPDSQAARRGLQKLGSESTPSTGKKPPTLPPSPAPSLASPPAIPDPPPISDSLFSGQVEPSKKPGPPSFLEDISGEQAPPAPQASTREAEPDFTKDLAPSPPTEEAEDEDWRSDLFSPDKVASAAMLEPETRPRRSLLDLFDVWATMIILNVRGGFDAEIRYGSFGHILVNIAAGSLLRVINSGILILLLFVAPNERFQPRLWRSVGELLTGLSEIQDMGSPLIPFQVSSGITDAAGGLSFGGWGILMVALLIYTVATLLFAFVGQMYQSMITNWVARWFNGRGDAIQTMQALTIAMVVTQIVALPFAMLAPFVTLGTALLFVGIVLLYQFIVTATALGHVHRINVLASVGVIIISSAVANFVASAAAWVFSLLFAIF